MMAVSDGMVPLVVGTVLALGALSLVLAPLLSGDEEPAAAPERNQPLKHSGSQNEVTSPAVLALREIEFDRATGKLSESDYADLKSRYTSLAVAELREADRAIAAGSGEGSAGQPQSDFAAQLEAVGALGSPDPVEAAIIRARVNQRVCKVCGPRPEPDATYCSGCGGYLAETCKSCSAPVEQPGARFCSECGKSLAA